MFSRISFNYSTFTSCFNNNRYFQREIKLLISLFKDAALDDHNGPSGLGIYER